MPQKNLSKIIVVDVEATCEKNKQTESEIIQVGVAELNLAYKSIDSTCNFYIKNIYEPITPFCTELTGITQEHLDANGTDFDSVCYALKSRFLPYTWASWGDYDRTIFEKNCARKYVPYPFGKTHINVKNLFALKYGLEKECGMHEALDILQLPLIGTHHNAVDDAYNIAKILGILL